MSQPKKIVFLDRDGTIIVDKIYLNDPEQIEYLPHAFESLKRLQDAGYEFVIATNQSGVPRGIVQIENLDKIHEKIANEFAKHDVKFLEFYYAPYMTDSGHPMRKPDKGMLMKAAEKYEIDYAASWMIGDRMTDVEAGHRAGCKSILLAGNDEESPEHPEFKPPEFYAQNLIEMTDYILGQ